MIDDDGSCDLEEFKRCTRYDEITCSTTCCFLSFLLSREIDCLARMRCSLVRLVLCFKCFKVAGSLYFQVSDDMVGCSFTIVHR
jgi:hypothetical protein